MGERLIYNATERARKASAPKRRRKRKSDKATETPPPSEPTPVRAED